MPTPTFKIRSHQLTYNALLAAAQDKTSEMYYKGKPHRGASHRAAFWDGYAGTTRSANVIPGTLSEVAFKAGKAFAKTNPGISKEDAHWIPGITRQGGSRVDGKTEAKATGTPIKPDVKLLKTETVGLWHAISNWEIMIRQMPKMDGITQDQIDAERGRLAAAKSGLRKVNKLRTQGL